MSSQSASDSPYSQNPDPKTLESQNPEISNQSDTHTEESQIKDENNVDEEVEEEGECGFCLFMKAGGCKDAFVSWENCVEEAEKNKEDIVEKCFKVTANLKNCMEAHSDYYEPILRAEKAAEEEVKQEIERESEKTNNDQNSGSKGVEESAEIEVQNDN